MLLQISELQKSLADTCDKLTQAMNDKAELQSDLESTKKEKSVIDTKLSEEKVRTCTVHTVYIVIILCTCTCTVHPIFYMYMYIACTCTCMFTCKCFVYHYHPTI